MRLATAAPGGATRHLLSKTLLHGTKISTESKDDIMSERYSKDKFSYGWDQFDLFSSDSLLRVAAV